MSEQGLTATQATELTMQALSKQVDISSWIECIDRQIHSAAKAGGNFVAKPFSRVRMPVNEVQIGLIKEHYVRNGFTWNEDGTISWRATT